MKTRYTLETIAGRVISRHRILARHAEGVFAKYEDIEGVTWGEIRSMAAEIERGRFSRSK